VLAILIKLASTGAARASNIKTPLSLRTTSGLFSDFRPGHGGNRQNDAQIRTADPDGEPAGDRLLDGIRGAGNAVARDQVRGPLRPQRDPRRPGEGVRRRQRGLSRRRGCGRTADQSQRGLPERSQGQAPGDLERREGAPRAHGLCQGPVGLGRGQRNGIHIGSALAEVEKLNGKPFKLSGFDWDYGGHVRDWQGGALAKLQPGGCIVAVEFVHPEDAPEENLAKVTGDMDVLSDSADLRAVEPYVGLLLISYPPR
jgi:hypothetical protein